ncbi:RING finger protein 207-like [Sycon ciliatum]|uniref:RING finger protein 207-like n=1 Tax=Sycon ciliatum TaxID=27933 RepID=UPI0031F6CB77
MACRTSPAQSGKSDIDSGLASSKICQACHLEADSLKILNCLHVMCLPCLKEHIGKDGTVSCFKCLTVGGSTLPGARLEDSLIDWPTPERLKDDVEVQSKAQESSAQPRCQNPDCSEAFEPAVSLCVDCGLHMCVDHERIHAKRKGIAFGHRVMPVAEIRSVDKQLQIRDKEFKKCFLHPGRSMTSYCTQCKVLICKQCSERFHIKCSKDVEEVQVIAERKRKEWKTHLTNYSEACKEQLQSTRTSIKARTNSINDEVEALSEKITADFQEHIKNIQQRQQTVLADLDAARWKALKRLEEKSEMVEMKSYQLNSCEYLVHNLGMSSLLAAEKFLHLVIEYVGNTANSSSKYSTTRPETAHPLPVAYSKFASDERWHVSELGELANVSSSPSIGDTASDDATLVVPAFDVASCEAAGLDVSEQGRELSCPTKAWVAVASQGSYSHGILQCSVLVVNGGRGLFLGVAVESGGKISECSVEKPFLGWHCRADNSEFCVGSSNKLGQPWLRDDVIVLRLDCDRHTLTGVNERTGYSETIAVPARRLCFAAEISTRSTIHFISDGVY